MFFPLPRRGADFTLAAQSTAGLTEATSAMKKGIQGLAGGAALLLASTSAFALGLSDAQVESALGQRLHLELLISSDEPEAPAVSLQADSLGNLQNSALSSELEALGPQQWRLHIYSAQPVWEPAVNLTVEVAQNRTRMRRALSVLLDPSTATRIARGKVEVAAVGAIDATADLAPPAADGDAPQASPVIAPAASSEARKAQAPRGRHSRSSHRMASDELAPQASPLPPQVLARFQLSGGLSTRSLQLIASGEAVQADAEADTPAETPSAAPADAGTPIAHPALLGSPSLSSIPSDVEQRVAAARDAGRDAFFVDQPVKVFFVLALCAVLLFGQARRLRRQMMAEQLQAA